MQNWIKNYRGFSFALIVAVVLVLATLAVSPFIPALLWATVLSVLTFPLYRRFNRRLAEVNALKDGRSENVAAFLVTLFTLVVICIPFALIAVGLFLQIGNVTTQLGGTGDLSIESILRQLDTLIRPVANSVGASKFSLENYVTQHREEILNNMRQPLQTFARQAGFTVLTIVFALLTQFFMLRDGHRLLSPVKEILPFREDRSQEMFNKLEATIKAVFVGTVLVAIIQGIVIGVTYGLVGLSNAILLGVISGILCIIPLLGAPVIYIPVAIFLLAQGKTTEALVVLGVGFIIVSQIDNVLKPFLIGGQVDLHPMAIFFSILGGVILIGPIGVMAGPMLLTIILVLYDIIREAVSELKAKRAPDEGALPANPTTS